MASYRRNQTAQNPATANVGAAVTILATMPEILAVLEEDGGVDLGTFEPHNDTCTNVDGPTQGTTPYAQESISRNF
jgi:hypothetical protein